MEEERIKELGIIENYLKNAALRRKINEGALISVDGLLVLNDKEYVLIEKETPHLTEKGISEISDITYGAIRRQEEQKTRLLAYYYKIMSAKMNCDANKLEPLFVKEERVKYGDDTKMKISDKGIEVTSEIVQNGYNRKKKSETNIWKKEIIVPENRNDNNSLLDRISESYQAEHTFSEAFMMMLEMKNMKGSECYNKAGVSRNIYSKLQRNRDYVPIKSNCISLCFGMELGLLETEYLLKIGGYALGNILFDQICSFFLGVRKFDVITVNEILENSNCTERLGSKS
ncbi:MAG: hypothetical protein ACOX1S_06700 [Anaerostipes sp.]|jgi:hypothetical protein